MFFERKCICIGCKKYKNKRKMPFFYDEIGICDDCYEKIKTTKDKSFDGGEGVKAVFSPYIYEGDIANAVKDFKFSGKWLLGKLFAQMMYSELKNISHIWEYDCLIPVPLHEKRLKERGYNQSEIMAEKISELSGVPMINDGIFRIRETKRQSSLTGMERRTNVKGAFFAAESAVSGKRIVLVDDICTMGETLRACADALLKAGAKEVIAITLCVSKKDKESFSLY